MNPISALSASATRSVGTDIAQQLMASKALVEPNTVQGMLAKAAQGTSDTEAFQRVVNQELDKDAFLELLVLQMQNQDPLEPMDNQDMLAQLAQFSSLEQMNNLSEMFAEMSSNLDQLNFIAANGLVGRQVTAISEDGTLVTGAVENVQMSGSVVHLSVDGHIVSMAGVQEIF